MTTVLLGDIIITKESITRTNNKPYLNEKLRKVNMRRVASKTKCHKIKNQEPLLAYKKTENSRRRRAHHQKMFIRPINPL